MDNSDRKITILIQIQKYCEGVHETIERFGKSFDTFKENDIFRDSVSMKVYQIGELTRKLYKDYNDFVRETLNEVEWEKFIHARDMILHHYEEIDLKIVFDIAVNDIPSLQKFVTKEIDKL